MTSALPPVLAHAGEVHVGGGELALTIMFVTVLAVIWIAVGVVCWIFWRAKKREDAEVAQRARASTAATETRAEWRNAPSS